MSRTEDIDNGIWDDPDFASLSRNATLLYIWSWTNPRCGMSGMYKVPLARMAESKVPDDEVQDALDELAAGAFLFYETGVLWVRARVKRLRARSPQMAKAIAKDLRNIPEVHPFVERFVGMYGRESWLRGFISIPLREGIDTVSDSPVGKGNPDTVSGPSQDGPRTGTGTGPREVGNEVSLPAPRASNGDVSELFDYWRDRCGHNSAKLTGERLAKIRGRLRDGYTVDQIRQAINGAARAPFVNDAGKRFDDIELICRNGSKLEDFMARSSAPRTGLSVVGRKQSAGDLINKIQGDDAA